MWVSGTGDPYLADSRTFTEALAVATHPHRFATATIQEVALTGFEPVLPA